MAGSADERAVRDAVVVHFHYHRPVARVVHEVNVGQGTHRADLAVIDLETVTLVEIKSRKDTLSRLAGQVTMFGEHAHRVIVVAHERWFEGSAKFNDPEACRPCSDLQSGCGSADLWRYPERPAAGRYDWMRYPWSSPPRGRDQPHAAKLLSMLWRAELLYECQRAGIHSKSRDTIPTLIERMAWNMTGAQIARGVCAQLRARHFAEGDPPVPIVASPAREEGGKGLFQ